VEEIVPAGALAETPDGLFVSGLYVTALVHAPRGAYPTACRGYYEHDPAQIHQYLAAARTPEAFHTYLERYVLAPHAVTQPAGV
jgi:glutaconate CoA-transferase subunit A